MWGKKKEIVEVKSPEIMESTKSEVGKVLASPVKVVEQVATEAGPGVSVLDGPSLWERWQKMAKGGTNCPYQGYVRNPYRRNQYGVDPLTELAWRLTIWKKENVFPIDLKIRAPAVFLSSLVLSYRIINSL